MDAIENKSEAIEREALASLHAHCPPQASEALGLALDEAGGALVASASKDPSILINRAAGMGMQREATEADVRAIIDTYTRRGVARYFLHLYPESMSPAAYAALPALGLSKVRGWRKFSRGAQPPAEVKSELRVERIGPERGMHFGNIVAPSFGMSAQGAPLLAGLASDPRWQIYVTYAGDEPAGAGALFILGDCAWLEWGATDPRFRQKGSQGAVMAARVRAALDAGCKHLFTETGEQVEGDPQHSYRNIERHGFVAGALRENWAPA